MADAKQSCNERHQIIYSELQIKESSCINSTLLGEDASEAVSPLMKLSRTLSYNFHEDHLVSEDLTASVTRLEAELLTKNLKVNNLLLLQNLSRARKGAIFFDIGCPKILPLFRALEMPKCMN